MRYDSYAPNPVTLAPIQPPDSGHRGMSRLAVACRPSADEYVDPLTSSQRVEAMPADGNLCRITSYVCEYILDSVRCYAGATFG